MDKVVYNQLKAEREIARLEVSSAAFGFNGRLPTRFTADGEGISPPLAWGEWPANAASIAIIVEDADSPTPYPLVHAIVVDIPPRDRSIPERALNSQRREGTEFDIGSNSFFEHAWLAPDPPPGHGEHRYVFQVFALLAGAAFSKSVGRREFVRGVLERAVAAGCLIGTYERSSRPETVSEAALAENSGMAIAT